MEELGEDVEHEVRPCTINPVGQSHRPVKHRYYPTLNFGDCDAAERYCRAVNEVANFLRTRTQIAKSVCLPARREKLIQNIDELKALFLAA